MSNVSESGNGSALSLAQCEQSAAVRISFWRPDVVRIQLSRDGVFRDTGLNRYGFILPPPARTATTTERTKDGFTVRSDCLVARFATANNEVVIEDKAGREILRQTGAAFQTGFAEAHFAAQPDEDWVGFGDQARDRLFHRGHLADLHVRNIKAYIPVPFFLSTRGYGVLANTTHRILFDMAKSDPGAFYWRDQRGTLDYYVLTGGDFKTLLRAYTDLTGKPKLPPLWAFGLWYLFRDEANDWEVIQTAERFRAEGIPCDVLGLEPGWMETNYDRTPDKKWHPGRFPMPYWKKPLASGLFTRVLKDMGFKLELWLCNDYDLSYEAERRVGTAVNAAEKEVPAFHPDGIEDAGLAAGAAAGRTDKLTRPDEPWFEHLKKFVEQGADFFKMDACAEVYRHADRIWGNGMSDAEMHNLYPLLYSRQMHEGFEEHTGRRGLAFNPCGWAGLHAWSATWTGDIGGKLDSLGSILNLAFAAQSWNTNDMAAASPEMFHFSYLLPLAQINGYGSFNQPWLQSRDAFAKHVVYARLRARLIPYLYTWAYDSTVTGCPLVRPLVLEFPDDATCRTVIHQYLLGRDLLVVVGRREAYFPAGQWIDFWTGERVEGGGTRPISWPDDRAGGLYLREGAILPLAPVMQYRGEKPLDSIELRVFPGPRESVLEFYEDDGESLRYRQGECSITRIRARRDAQETVVDVAAANGDYAGRPGVRHWAFTVFVPQVPTKVTANGRELAPGAWRYDPACRVIHVESQKAPVTLRLQA